MSSEPRLLAQFRVLGFMASLRAARDFGLDSVTANEIALQFDPRYSADPLVDALADALIESGAVRVPDSV